MTLTGQFMKDGKSLVENVILGVSRPRQPIVIPPPCPSSDPAMRHSLCFLTYVCLSLENRTAPARFGLHPGSISLWASIPAQKVRWSPPETELHKGKFLLGWSEAPPCHPDTAAQIPSCCILELPSELLWRSRITRVLVLLPQEMCLAEGSIEQVSHFPAQEVFGAV